MGKLKILAATIAALAVPLSANATLALQLSDGTTTIAVNDGSLLDSSSTAGVVTYIGAIGSWTVNVSTGIGGVNLPAFSIDFNSVNLSTQSGTLSLLFSETDLSLGGYGSIPMHGGIGGTTDGTVSYALYADANNTLFGQQQTIFSGGPLGGLVFGATGTGSADLTGPFSLTQWIEITHGSGAKVTSFDFKADPVPEPGTLALLSLGLLGAGVFSRRRIT